LHNVTQLQVANHKAHEHLFLNLRKNIVEIPSGIYNPIIPSPGLKPMQKIFLIASDACFAAYANTNSRRHCNAEIFEHPPQPTDRSGHWVRELPFQSLQQWIEVMTSPILSLRLTRNVRKGEEIFVYYELPEGIQRLKTSTSINQPLNTITEHPILHGTIALEGEEAWSTLSGTHSPTDESQSGYSGEEDSTRPTSPDTSPLFGPSAPQAEIPVFSPPMDQLPSTFTKQLSLCAYMQFDA
jgi:hypothetical protein